MEKMLLKMAHQLNAMDEASLMALWNKYLQRVQDFDASESWEEAAIVLSLIQAVRSKNQLFNTKLEEREALRRGSDQFSAPRFRAATADDREKPRSERRATVHQFRPLA
mgnify:FL=1